MATNLALDDGLIEAARKIGKHKTKKQAVTAALQEYVDRRKRSTLRNLFGQINFDPQYDYKRQRDRKPR
jgi:Arc/MetJ family transcription regulator